MNNKQKDESKSMTERKKRKVLTFQQQINDLNYQWKDGEQFPVEKIFGEAIWDNKKYYLVKWKGFDLTMSTWEREIDIGHMTTCLSEFQKTTKGKNQKKIRQDANKLMNPYRATEIHGHFLYGDVPKQIVSTLIEFGENSKKTIYLQIEWEPRQIQQGYQQLQNSWLSSDLIFEHNPKFLLDYYKRSMKLASNKQ